MRTLMKSLGLIQLVFNYTRVVRMGWEDMSASSALPCFQGTSQIMIEAVLTAVRGCPHRRMVFYISASQTLMRI